jgi:L-arabonate dehydrase
LNDGASDDSGYFWIGSMRNNVARDGAHLEVSGGIAVVRGNLAPDGAVITPSAASVHLMRHRGRTVVFENIENYKQRIDDPALDVDESCFLILKNCGPKGYPRMPEVGNMGCLRNC